MPSVPRLLMVLAGSAVYVGLAVLGEGGFAAYFSIPALSALAGVTLLISVVALFAGGNISKGVREDRGNRWVLVALIGLGLLNAVLPALADRAEVWPLDGDAVRWLGVVLYAGGCVARIWPVFVLGDRFSGLVAIQPGHRLVTGGIYSVIRHPSYLGLLVASLGWGLGFRSGVGVLITALMVPPIIARIVSEERMLRSEFGAEYDAYRSRTSRLLPGIW